MPRISLKLGLPVKPLVASNGKVKNNQSASDSKTNYFLDFFTVAAADWTLLLHHHQHLQHHLPWKEGRNQEVQNRQEKGWQPTRLTLNYAYSTFNCCMAKEKEPDTQDDIWTTRIKGPSGQINTFFYSKYFVFFIGRFLTLKHLKSERKSLLNIFCSKFIGRFRLFPRIIYSRICWLETLLLHHHHLPWEEGGCQEVQQDLWGRRRHFHCHTKPHKSAYNSYKMTLTFQISICFLQKEMHGLQARVVLQNFNDSAKQTIKVNLCYESLFV